MSRIEQVTKYRCDGCGTESKSTIGWYTLHYSQGINLVWGAIQNGEDYCSFCVGKMRQAVKDEK